MNINILFSYILRCNQYGWQPTWFGLWAFKKEVKAGLRIAPNYEWRKYYV